MILIFDKSFATVKFNFPTIQIEKLVNEKKVKIITDITDNDLLELLENTNDYSLIVVQNDFHNIQVIKLKVYENHDRTTSPKLIIFSELFTHKVLKVSDIENKTKRSVFYKALPFLTDDVRFNTYDFLMYQTDSKTKEYWKQNERKNNVLKYLLLQEFDYKFLKESKSNIYYNILTYYYTTIKANYNNILNVIEIANECDLRFQNLSIDEFKISFNLVCDDYSNYCK